MIEFKYYIAKQLVGHKLHFKCDCLIPLDINGVIKDFEILNNEILFILDVDGKIVKIGENHPNLKVE